MEKGYKLLQKIFEQITSAVTTVLGSPITFILALIMIAFWFSNREYSTHHVNETIRDIIHGVSFLTLFVIQKAFSHFSASLQVKLDELILSHEPANNAIINIEKKTEHEITEIQHQYSEIATHEDAKSEDISIAK